MAVTANHTGWIAQLIAKSPLVATLWKTWRTYWRNAFWWALCSLTGGMMPFWATLFIRWAYGLPFNVQGFILRGDFALYAAAFLAPALYQVAVRMKKQKSVLGTGAIIMSSLGLVFSAFIYTVVNGTSTQVRNTTGVVRVSFGLLLLAFLFAVCVFLNEQQLEVEDLATAELIDRDILNTRMDGLAPQPAHVAPIDIVPPAPADSEADLKRLFIEGENAPR